MNDGLFNPGQMTYTAGVFMRCQNDREFDAFVLESMDVTQWMKMIGAQIAM